MPIKKQKLSSEILEKFDKTKDFNAMSVESLNIIFKILKSLDLKEHSAKSLANLGKSIISNIRKSRKVLESENTSKEAIDSTIKLLDDLFLLLNDILLAIEDSHDLGLVEPHERNLVVSFIGEYLKVCNEEETYRTEPKEIEEEENLSEKLTLDGIVVKDLLDTFILES